MIDTREAVILEHNTYKVLDRGVYDYDALERFVKQGKVVIFPVTDGRDPDFPKAVAVPHPDTKLIVEPWYDCGDSWGPDYEVNSLAGVTLERYACNLEGYAEDRREVFLKAEPNNEAELKFIQRLIDEAWAVREIHSFIGADTYCSSTTKIREMVAAGLLDAERFSYFLEK